MVLASWNDEKIILTMFIPMKGTMKMTKSMDSVNVNGYQENPMVEIGKMDFKMEVVS